MFKKKKNPHWSSKGHEDRLKPQKMPQSHCALSCSGELKSDSKACVLSSFDSTHSLNPSHLTVSRDTAGLDVLSASIRGA